MVSIEAVVQKEEKGRVFQKENPARRIAAPDLKPLNKVLM